jgi:hypothetical protein
MPLEIELYMFDRQLGTHTTVPVAVVIMKLNIKWNVCMKTRARMTRMRRDGIWRWET